MGPPVLFDFEDAIHKVMIEKAQDLHRLRHSAAHILAQAVRRLWPQTRLAIGPPIEEGFYYDLDLPQPITDEDLPKIEAEMKKIIDADLPFKQSWMGRQEALDFFGTKGERFKQEIIREIQDEKVSIYTDGEFMDLCEGPHMASTGQVKAVKLLSLAGAYWRGDERNPQLTRIYGTAFFDKKELEEFLKRREEAKKRDHRKLGQELRLFSILEEAGAGLVFYQPKGAVVRQLIESYSRQEHARRGYVPVLTPHVLRSDIWVRSGHYDHYKPNMYMFKVEEQEWGIKPMNCPGHILIYQTALHSYRELPLRFFELGTVYRNEKSGVLHGLLRVRGFTQDDSHIFCRPSQLESELSGVLDFIRSAMSDFGFREYKIELSTRPPEFMGDESQWIRAEEVLKRVLESQKVPYQLSPGAGAFYGPKIDVHVKDTLGRYWQCATAQLDYVLPQRFGLRYAEENGQEAQPVMIHRAIFGSLERFLGTLIEHYGGAFPVWLAPVQAVVIPVTPAQESYAGQVGTVLADAGIRVETDSRKERFQAKIRDAELNKIPYMLVVGQREADSGQVSVRSKNTGDQGAVTVEEFLSRITEEIKNKV
ncbi:MAG: threonine--tRNA ligase [Candidatus Omnitrophica bacterium]|nr:threonine--tRNA ligase [Candidatus Omnitrophota bacterium]